MIIRHVILHFMILLMAMGGAAMASNEPRYRIETTPPSLAASGAEIRVYDSVLIASVKVRGNSWRDASSMAFRPLANYIFGENASNEKIGMTTPVTTHQVTIPETGERLWEVRFFMPERYSRQTLPSPQSPYVSLDEQKQMRFAVIKFSGHAQGEVGSENFITHEAKLRYLLDKANIPSDGVAHYAVYNGPWTPAMMRRNEVLITLP